MKRLICLTLFALVLLLSLVACGGNDEEQQTTVATNKSISNTQKKTEPTVNSSKPTEKPDGFEPDENGNIVLPDVPFPKN